MRILTSTTITTIAQPASHPTPTPMPDDPEPQRARPHPLAPELARTEEELDENLQRVCEEPPVSEVDTGELIRIEETLAIAARAAKEAVSLRRRVRADGAPEGENPEGSGR